MRKINYFVVTFVNSVGFLLLFGLLVFFQVEYSKYSTKTKKSELIMQEVDSAYLRFVEGRALNSDYSFWKKTDNQLNSFQLKKVDESLFLKGVAVFQKAFWSKYKDKNKTNDKNEISKMGWADGIEISDNKLKKQILARYPIKDRLNKKLNWITLSAKKFLHYNRESRELVFNHLLKQYGLFFVYLLFNVFFYLRKDKVILEKIITPTESLEIEDCPTLLVKLVDDKITSFSNKLKELTPEISTYENWDGYFNSVFSIVKNVSGEKIVTLRKSSQQRYKIVTSIKGKVRYVNLNPIVTIVKQEIGTIAGNDSFNELLKESIHRIELLNSNVKYKVDFQNDIFINEDLSRKIEEVINLAGTFYKKLCSMQGVKSNIEVNTEIKNSMVSINFTSTNLKMDANLVRKMSNFNFGFYPQKIEDVLCKNEGKVTVKNKYTKEKIFVSSLFTISFDLKLKKYKFTDNNVETGSFN